MTTSLVLSTCLMAMLGGCSATYGIHRDVGRDSVFASIETYALGRVRIEAEQDALTVAHVQEAVDRVLRSKGYSSAVTRPDCTLDVAVETRERPAEPPDPYAALYGGYAAPPVPHYEDVHLVLGFYLPEGRDPIWRGSAFIDTSGLTAEQLVEAIHAATERILTKVPARPTNGDPRGPTKE